MYKKYNTPDEKLKKLKKGINYLTKYNIILYEMKILIMKKKKIFY